MCFKHGRAGEEEWVPRSTDLPGPRQTFAKAGTALGLQTGRTEPGSLGLRGVGAAGIESDGEREPTEQHLGCRPGQQWLTGHPGAPWSSRGGRIPGSQPSSSVDGPGVGAERTRCRRSQEVGAVGRREDSGFSCERGGLRGSGLGRRGWALPLLPWEAWLGLPLLPVRPL